MTLIEHTLLAVFWASAGFLAGWLLRCLRGYYHVRRNGELGRTERPIDGDVKLFLRDAFEKLKRKAYDREYD